MNRLIEIIERGIFEKGAEPAPGACWSVDGVINGRPVRVIFAERNLGDFTIVTVMWLS